MTAAMIAQLLITFGPQAVGLIQNLIALWDKPSLTVDEVKTLCACVNTPFAQGLTATGSTTVVKNPLAA